MGVGLPGMFSPKSVAIVGASADAKKYAYRPLSNLLRTGFSGELFPVNSGRTEVLGLKAYKRVSDVPICPELVIVVVPAREVERVVAECAVVGCGNVVVISGGFKDVGATEREDRLKDLARAHGINLLGPNCTGFVNVLENVAASSSLIFNSGMQLLSGNVAVISQSGGMGLSILRACSSRRIGISHFVSVGNEAGLSAIDVADALLELPCVSTVGLYRESLGDGRELLRLGARAAAAGKAVVLLKVGETRLGKRLAETHTGALTSSSGITRAVLSRSELAYTEDLDDFIGALQIRSREWGSGLDRVLIMTSSGGFGVIAADECERNGLGLAELTAPSVDRLRAVLPELASVATNPVDIMPLSGGTGGLRAAAVSFEFSEIDSLMLILPPEHAEVYLSDLVHVAGVAKTWSKALIVAMAGSRALQDVKADTVNELVQAGAACFDSPVSAVRAVSVVRRSREARGWIGDVGGRSGIGTLGRSSAVPIPMQELWAQAAKCGVGMPAQGIGMSVDDALSVAESIGYPVVVKALLPGVTHKSEKDAVRINVPSSQRLLEVLRELQESVGVGIAPGVLHYVIQSFVVRPNVEVLIGVVKHESFGAAMVVGSGGVLAELYADVAYGLCPTDEVEALDLLAKTKVYKLLCGYRGRSPADVAGCVQSMLRVGDLFRRSRAVELEVNPLLVGEDFTVAVDVRAFR